MGKSGLFRIKSSESLDTWFYFMVSQFAGEGFRIVMGRNFYPLTGIERYVYVMGFDMKPLCLAT